MNDHHAAYGDEHDDDCPLCGVDAQRDTQSYGDAPRWYWAIASHIVGWRSEVTFWFMLMLLGGSIVGLAFLLGRS